VGIREKVLSGASKEEDFRSDNQVFKKFIFSIVFWVDIRLPDIFVWKSLKDRLVSFKIPSTLPLTNDQIEQYPLSPILYY
jgi:hypothetical protein